MGELPVECYVEVLQVVLLAELAGQLSMVEYLAEMELSPEEEVDEIRGEGGEQILNQE